MRKIFLQNAGLGATRRDICKLSRSGGDKVFVNSSNTKDIYVFDLFINLTNLNKMEIG